MVQMSNRVSTHYCLGGVRYQSEMVLELLINQRLKSGYPCLHIVKTLSFSLYAASAKKPKRIALA